MSTLQTFDFHSNSVRIQNINGKEYFCAKDICDILGYQNSTKAIQDNCKKDGITTSEVIDSLGRNQKATFITEANLLRLIVKSKLSEAEKFEAWIFEEILPTIRKTGKFEINQPKIDSQFLLQLSQEMAKKEQLIEAQQITIATLEVENIQKQEQVEAEKKENQKLKITIKNFFKGAELFTRRQVCHFLARQGLEVKEQEITDFLNKKKWLCKGEHNTNKATAESCRIAWFVNDISIYEVKGRKKTSEYGKFTVDGLIGMYETFKLKPVEFNK